MPDSERTTAKALSALSKARGIGPPPTTAADRILEMLTGYPTPDREASALDVLLAAVPFAGAVRSAVRGGAKAIRAYHGSPKPVGALANDRPMFFAETPSHAAQYRAGEATGANIIPADLLLTNPKTVTSELLGSAYHERMEIERAIAEGHDGIIWKSPRHPEVSYIAFRPRDQVRTPGQTPGVSSIKPSLFWQDDR